LQVFDIENMSVKRISSIRKINKIIVSGREQSSARFHKKNCEVRKISDFPISKKEFGDEKKKNEETENVATFSPVFGDRTWKKRILAD